MLLAPLPFPPTADPPAQAAPSPSAWDSLWPTTVSGLLSGLAVVLIGGIIVYHTTTRWERRRGLADEQRARRLSTVEELYGAYGDFFAVWKAWEYYTAAGKPGSIDPAAALTDALVADLTARAATAEARLERFLVQVTLEQPLTEDDEATLWALRHAMRKLRYVIRRRLPLEWWRAAAGEHDREAERPFREYRAYKGLVSLAAAIATRATAPADAEQPSPRALAKVTGSGSAYTDRFIPDPAAARADIGIPEDSPHEGGWQWLPVAEALLAQA